MRTKECPTCGGEIRVSRNDETGDEVYCDVCEREFVILSIAPLRLEPVEEYDDYNFEDDDLDDFR